MSKRMKFSMKLGVPTQWVSWGWPRTVRGSKDDLHLALSSASGQLRRLPLLAQWESSGGKLEDSWSVYVWHLAIYYSFNLSCTVLSHSVVSDSLRPHGLQPTRLLCPWGFSRQEYWSGLPYPSPGDLLNPGIKPRYPVLQLDSLPTKPKPKHLYSNMKNKLIISKLQ